MRIIILGCGSSGGVPLITGEWGNCDPNNPRNRRRRASILLEIQGKIILIDAGPDMREQLLDTGITNIDAVIFTHAHSDHLRGIDDLRQFAIRNKHPIPLYGDEHTLKSIKINYPYALCQVDEFYPSFVTVHPFSEGKIVVAGIEMCAFPQHHGNMVSWGFRVGDFAYSTDFHHIPDKSLSQLRRLKCWVVDCLRFKPHPTHSFFAQTVELIQKLQPEQAILTHMNQDFDYDEAVKHLPPGIQPGIDGMIVEFSGENVIIYDKVSMLC
ncbi:MBL fold metallo-hydrolase [Candidatus Paracaedibacter symbiosus]|uniref:MBL fold metallo-hydrolase n=1 Tax=Candidatus Paracaedibacter symbiosus TaxID=244582 RepID=UPI00068F5E7E|nr:MBL fold metallo-hydrolase [Candidatus Paracaedibacter symbiosus]